MLEQSDLLLGGSQEWDQGGFMHMCVSGYMYIYVYIKSACVCIFYYVKL